MHKIEINPKFEKVLDFINETNQTIFLTGKAGTGKTTLLKYIREKTFKQLAVIAPTGVAAINAGGSTIHSFFQFPFTPFLPVINTGGNNLTKNNPQALKYTSQRLAIFRSLELLIIDEVSMVRADLLDQIDQTLRVVRRRSSVPFGGVQILLVGDMYQLPPVVQQEEWKLLSSVYKSPFFFDSLVMRQQPPVYIELDKIYRQSERVFVDLLNKVRDARMDPAALELLNSHFRSNITEEERRTSITLTTHNRKADEINQRNLDALPAKAYSFKAKVQDNFPEKNYPVEEVLVIKTGCRVMFLKNNNEKNYYNGKIGVVTELTEEKIKVKCEEDHQEIEVARETWTNVAYKADKAATHIEEEILGTFNHFPLRLAWAITIHKSQGLTFDKLIIDAAEAFSAGQVYVALSRCRSLSGLTLSTRIRPESLLSDVNITNFAGTRPDDLQVNEIYGRSRASYLRQLVAEVFDLNMLKQQRTELGGVIQQYRNRFNREGLDWFAKLSERIDLLYDVSQRFARQLHPLLEAAKDPEKDEALQERLKQAAKYFSEELSKCLRYLDDVPLRTESREAVESFEPLLSEFYGALFTKDRLCETMMAGFNLSLYVRTRMQSAVPQKKFSIFSTAANTRISSEVHHPSLYRALMLLRDEIVNDERLPVAMVAGSKTLTELANYLPDTEEKLLQITGFGEKKVEQIGDRFLKVIRQFMRDNELQSQMPEKPAKKTRKAKKENTAPAKKPNHEKSYELFRQGMKPADIARELGFTEATILTHLVRYVQRGDIPLSDLVEEKKIKLIEKSLEKFSYEDGLTVIKETLPENISYSDIRLVMAWRLREV